MATDQSRLLYLYDRFLNDACTPEEVHEFWVLLDQVTDEEALREHAMQFYDPVNIKAGGKKDWGPALQRIFNQPEATGATGLITAIRDQYRWYAAAAAIFILLCAGGIGWLVHHHASSRLPVIAAAERDLEPGRSRAFLTLDDGTVIALDSTGNQVLQQGPAAIHQQGGQLIYNVNGYVPSAAYNTLATPRGGQFRVTLPDGSKVWLNAASSLRYPTAFTGKERLVEVTGEAYFEIARDTRRPFRVNVNARAVIEVLGTGFNVNAYTNESSINTTLLEGTVKVSAGSKTRLLKPGQQAQVSGNSLQLLEDVDLGRVVAWKNGLFYFSNLELEEIMRQLERWYDIKVVFEGKVPQRELVGKMSKDVPLSGVLKYLGDIGIQYRLEGRKLIILPDAG